MAAINTYPPRPSSSALLPTFLNSSKPDNSYVYKPADGSDIPLTHSGARSPSPTPSEKKELEVFDGTIRRMFRKDNWKDKDFILSVALTAFIIAVIVVVAVFQEDIVNGLIPAAEWIKKTPAAFLIPIAIMVILSIPPLFGAEIVHIMCGFTYGLGIGFALVCAGTIIGEIITFYMFRSCLRSRAEKMEHGKGSLRWASLGRVIREGGFTTALVVRYSAIPTHIITAVFAVTGVTFRLFALTLVLSLPRQLAGVQIGVLTLQTYQGNETSKQDKTLSRIIIAITVVITIIAMMYVTFIPLQLVRQLTPSSLSVG
ncbi:hypothetical protein BDV93DRAFT_449502 [Ceratobasidium sp. AG-I]|nr:hypothetical protein BDV93DRAFT_449502 [Ceratobasidium sp. AG-I]